MRRQGNVIRWLKRKTGYEEALPTILPYMDRLENEDLDEYDLIRVTGHCLITIYMRESDLASDRRGTPRTDWGNNYSAWSTYRKAAEEDATWYVRTHVKVKGEES